MHTFGARCSIDVLDPENQPRSGSGKIRIRTQGSRADTKSLNQKKAFEIIWNIHSIFFLKILHKFEVKSLGSEFGWKPDPEPRYK